MTNKYCVFLRGINVNGIKITTDALKEAFHAMGFLNVKTILATGNVIISESKENRDSQELKSLIEKKLGSHFNYDAHVILRGQTEIMEIYSASQLISVPEGCHNYLILSDDKELLLELEQLFASIPHIPQEQFFLSTHGAYWIVPKGSTLDSDFGSKILGDKKYKSRLTSRNMNTVEKVRNCMLAWV